MKIRPALVALSLAGMTSGCLRPGQGTDEPMTYGEASSALEEASIANQARTVMSGTVEIATNFTIGGAVQAAAEEIRDFLVAELPCAELLLENATLTIEYGKKPGNCTYRGQSYSGTHAITVMASGEGEVFVHHAWDELSNGLVSVSGTADVTWDFANPSRHVVSDLAWTRLSDGRTGKGHGDQIETPLDGDLTQGIAISGDHSWKAASGTWTLGVDDVEARWIDPVPQDGTFVLTTPGGKNATLDFSRADATTIHVVFETGGKAFDFDVHSLGF